jgi:hypothetical protein
MKKEERRSGAVSRSFDYCDEDGGEFVALGTERLQLGRWHNFSIDEEFQPIRGFLQFPKRVAAFGNELARLCSVHDALPGSSLRRMFPSGAVVFPAPEPPSFSAGFRIGG